MADEAELRNNLYINQSMIDVSAELLVGLRTKCATNSELTQQEIRTLEGKLIKLFSNQLVMKVKLGHYRGDEHIPSLKQWLQVVGLGRDSVQALCQKFDSIEELQDKPENELKTLLNEKGAKTEEVNRLSRAMRNLKRYTDVLKRGGIDNTDIPLHWDSWDREHPPRMAGLSSPRMGTGRSRAARASVPSEESMASYNNNNNRGGAIPPSSSVSSINSLNAQCGVLGPPLTPSPQTRGKGMKFPTTPPPRRKHRTNTPALLPDSYPLTKSKSHESQLAKGEKDNGELEGVGPVRRNRLPTEPGPDTDYNSVLTSPVKSPPYNNTGTDSDDNSYKSATSLQVPKSPRTTAPVGRNMTHQIKHRFTKSFTVMTTCCFCQKQIYFVSGLKCKECKYTCHRDCEEKVTPSCGLPGEFLDEFIKKNPVPVFPSPNAVRATTNKLYNFARPRKKSNPQTANNLPLYHQQPPDSSSNTSSCNSSTPSSPAVQSVPTPHSSQKQTFHFPDVHCERSDIFIETHLLNPVHNDSTSSHQNSRDGDRTVSVSGSTSTDSDKTPVRVDSQDSQVSDTETITDGHKWPRQNSVSMKEWDIPFEELKVSELIGTGRFGTVYRGNWYGDVAVKVLNMHHLDDEKTLEQFKMEVAIFRKTRHENVILFMGACTQPPKLAIVTSLSKGVTLYTHIHLRKDKFNMNKTTIVAQQISQGMGYLHSRGIVHKDLKSNNIFLENGKVVISDFGLFSVTKLCFGNRKNDSLGIPPGWLCHLSPEIIRSLHAHQAHNAELPFSEASDVYAFGTVWYELLCGELPFKLYPPEAVIWQVGKGIKQPLANLQASRDVKDILMSCWAFQPKDRPDFLRLLESLKKLPKKRLARSPSHPIHLSRSAESVF